VNRFAELLDGLSFTHGRLGKLRLMKHYFAASADPERGWALAALTGELGFREAKSALIRGLVEARIDPVLFHWSQDFVGDLAETAALIWPAQPSQAAPPSLSDIVASLELAGKSAVPALLSGWLDALDATGRWALLKLLTGELRVGVSARLAKTALAEWGGVGLDGIEEVWHSLLPPYQPLFDWLTGNGPKPDVSAGAAFRPIMLAQPLEEEALHSFAPQDWRAEWKWDGIRVQLVARGGERKIYSRTGDEASRAFPDIVPAMNFDAVLDGELLVGSGGEVAAFNDLQQRLNRKSVDAKLAERFPAFVRLYDILFEGDEDLRPLPFDARRARLEAWYGRATRPRLDLSPLIPFTGWDELKRLREAARANAIEGLMLKRRDSPYVAGRPKGPWFKWKRNPLTADCVLMYAQRGSGKRSSFYSDFTFGCWRGDALVPVGKAYFGFTDEELTQLDRWVRNNTVKRFGPVREVAPGLVLEIAFDSLHRSTRHKSGLAMRFPRVHRIRWDKPAGEADRLETLEHLVT
jgi:DNA ligase 1